MTEENKKGRLFIVTAPSGAGKTSLIKALIELCPQFKVSTSHTTRKPRQGEREEIDYYFVDNDAFNTLKNSGELDSYSFVWSSPPCPSHSRARFARRNTTTAVYPDMKLYEETDNLMKHPIITSDFVKNIFLRDIFTVKIHPINKTYDGMVVKKRV